MKTRSKISKQKKHIPHQFKLNHCFLFHSENVLDTNRILDKSNTTNTNHHNSIPDPLKDLDSEEAALHEFDFLSGDAATAGLTINEFKSSGIKIKFEIKS